LTLIFRLRNQLLGVWLRSHADGSRHTRRACERIGRRFLEALAATGANLRRHTIDDVQAALEASAPGRTARRRAARPST
jgi:hypothetical protein